MRFKGFGQSRSLSAAFLLVILLAYGLKALIPAGFMPEAAHDGFAKMVICSGFGEKTVYVPQEQVPSSPAPHSGSKICEFQVSVSHKGLDAVGPVILPPPTILSRNDFAPVSVQPPLRRFGAAISARGPPASV